MAKKPTDVSGGSTAPPSTGKTVAGQGKGGVNIEVPFGRMAFKGYPPQVTIQSSAQAVKALGIVSSTATETGHLDVAKAAEGLRTQFVNVINVYGDHATVHQHQELDLSQHYTSIQKSIKNLTEAATSAGVDFFGCKEAFDQCMAKATGLGAQVHCSGLYAACVSAKLASAFKP